MCVILIGKIGHSLHRQAKAQNPDGFSLLTKEQGLIKAPSSKEVDLAVHRFGIWHYRIKSSGKVDKTNIHPFEVCNGNYVLYHNGVLGAGTQHYSDTYCLAYTLKNSPLETVKTVLQSLSSGQRFCLANVKDPREFYLYGDWKVESGVLMSHKMYSMTTYYSQSKAVQAGWSSKESAEEDDIDSELISYGVTRDSSCYPNLRAYMMRKDKN